MSGTSSMWGIMGHVGRDISSIDISALKGVGPKVAGLLQRLGITSVRDALFYLPFRYEDRRSISQIVDASDGTLQSFTGKVISADLLDLSRGGMKVTARDSRTMRPVKGRGRGRLLFEAVLSDGSGLIKAKWFNQPFLAGKIRPGTQVVISGKVRRTRWAPHFEIENPAYDVLDEREVQDESKDGSSLHPVLHSALHAGGSVPVYQSTEGLSPRRLRTIISAAVEGFASEAEDSIPQHVLSRAALPGLHESIQSAHFPPDDADLDAFNRWATPWQKRIAFGELFMLEAGLAVLRQGKRHEKGFSFKPVESGQENNLVDRLMGALPFELTRAQHRALEALFKDMASPRPMSRLLQGDVGSGKTIVALGAMLRAVECGYQAALMAPTEILAAQHFFNIQSMLEELALDVEIRLITSSSRKKGLECLASGEAQIAVGTHALIQEGVAFKALGLAVVDEQHRFGVMQRAEFRKKADKGHPDMLIMTATPIPRTLSLTLYGDLDYSVIDELPPGRTPVLTTMHAPDDKPRVYEAITTEVAAGGQAYVVYPLIEESENADLKSAVTGREALARMYPDMRVEMVHGRMRPAEKQEVMSGFKSGIIDILVSTTVIEVGVDVPNASLMVIVNSERFGLAQLHQLRGRVGRGKRASRCMLLYGATVGDDARRRLEIMCATNDGFKVAQRDLEIRGPGEFLGTRQSGMPDLRVANIMRDAALLETARREAFALVDEDPEFSRYPALRVELERFWRAKVELFKAG